MRIRLLSYVFSFLFVHHDLSHSLLLVLNVFYGMFCMSFATRKSVWRMEDVNNEEIKKIKLSRNFVSRYEEKFFCWFFYNFNVEATFKQTEYSQFIRQCFLELVTCNLHQYPKYP